MRYADMTPAQQAEINAQEAAREARKGAFAGADEVPSDADLVAMADAHDADQDAYDLDGHHDHRYW